MKIEVFYLWLVFNFFVVIIIFKFVYIVIISLFLIIIVWENISHTKIQSTYRHVRMVEI